MPERPWMQYREPLEHEEAARQTESAYCPRCERFVSPDGQWTCPACGEDV